MKHLTSAFNIEGYFDNYNFTSEKLSSNSSYLLNRTDCSVKNGSKNRWEFAFSPNVGFLGNPEPLIRDCELKLSFDRANPYISVLETSEGTKQEKPFVLKDVMAITEYVSSNSIVSYFDKISHTPVRYEFDDCDVLGLIYNLTISTITILN